MKELKPKILAAPTTWVDALRESATGQSMRSRLSGVAVRPKDPSDSRNSSPERALSDWSVSGGKPTPEPGKMGSKGMMLTVETDRGGEVDEQDGRGSEMEVDELDDPVTVGGKDKDKGGEEEKENKRGDKDGEVVKVKVTKGKNKAKDKKVVEDRPLTKKGRVAEGSVGKEEKGKEKAVEEVKKGTKTSSKSRSQKKRVRESDDDSETESRLVESMVAGPSKRKKRGDKRGD
ncbi:hypothetical protein JAAARDRAFT_201010 [Jaapia argillacea MUCL 33604]|uniref:Uncharacterized protein n=1 Tax=Jaapia argillacea MUCL 33604 TaxID=933084 RepID=A0A067PFK6_9AGAM|nr:hypothetical protein JAAARDRAFT_201010 [Jaapia argillacea MUCL 33604]